MASLVTPSDYAEFFSLERVFITALLLTGDVDRAEAVVLDAIDKLDLETTTHQALLEQVARAATAHSEANSPPASVKLVPHLRRVMELPPALRHCFVLRVLARIDLRQCADILQIGCASVDDLTIEAACRLITTQLRQTDPDPL